MLSVYALDTDNTVMEYNGMCLAIPARIIEKHPNDMLLASVGNSSTHLHVSGMLLAEPVEIGDYVIIHAGFALHKMDRTEAEESLRLFNEIAALEQPGEPKIV